MKIIQVLSWNNMGGTEKICIDLCNQLCKKHQVYFLSNKKAPYLDKKIIFLKFDFNHNKNKLFFKELVQKIKIINPDIIHAHKINTLKSLVRIKKDLHKKIPIVITKHSLIFNKNFALADAAIAVSYETLKTLNTHKKIVIPNGIPCKKAQRLNLARSFNIVAIGRLVPQKGFDKLIIALSKIQFNFNLTLLGEGDEKERLENMSKKLNIEKQIHIKGFVDNIQDYLYSSDLQVITSKYESFGLIAIEGIYYSKVLISTPVGISNDILPQKFIFDDSVESLVKKINDVYENYSEYSSEFSKIKKIKDQYGIEKMTNEYIKVYESVK